MYAFMHLSIYLAVSWLGHTYRQTCTHMQTQIQTQMKMQTHPHRDAQKHRETHRDMHRHRNDTNMHRCRNDADTHRHAQTQTQTRTQAQMQLQTQTQTDAHTCTCTHAHSSKLVLFVKVLGCWASRGSRESLGHPTRTHLPAPALEEDSCASETLAQSNSTPKFGFSSFHVDSI